MYVLWYHVDVNRDRNRHILSLPYFHQIYPASVKTALYHYAYALLLLPSCITLHSYVAELLHLTSTIYPRTQHTFHHLWRDHSIQSRSDRLNRTQSNLISFVLPVQFNHTSRFIGLTQRNPYLSHRYWFSRMSSPCPHGFPPSSLNHTSRWIRYFKRSPGVSARANVCPVICDPERDQWVNKDERYSFFVAMYP